MKLSCVIGLFISFICSVAYSQYNEVHKDLFEVNQNWIFEGNGPNQFVIGSCAGNAAPNPGNGALYVAYNSGNSPTCDPINNLDYGYTSSSTGLDSVLAYTAITANNCGQNLVVDFKYKLGRADANDQAKVYYRLNAASSWVFVGLVSNVNTTWGTTASFQLPTSLNGQNFHLAFVYTFDNANHSGEPFAIDDLIVKGIDAINPTIVCPPTFSLHSNSLCQLVLPDLTALVTAQAIDNCTPTADLSFSQNPMMGATIANGDSVSFTVFDLALNEASCKSKFIAIDTIKPVIVCNQVFDIPTNSISCDYAVPNLENQVVSFADNCSDRMDATFTQNPAIGSSVSGVQNILMTVTDGQGNATSCYIRLVPVDTIAPTITCPPTQTISNGTSCSYTVADFSNLVTVSDNCTVLTPIQSPAVNTIIPAGNHVFTYEVRDEVGNVSRCNFEVKVIENQAPVFTNCPNGISSCDSIVTFASLQATDNCVYGIYKQDLTGLNSGDVFPRGVTNLSYVVKDSSGNSATCAFTVTVDFPDSPAFIESPVQVCNDTQATIDAVPVTYGTGVWSVPSGSSLVIANPTQATTTVSGLAPGDNTVIWTTSGTNTNCPSTSEVLIVKNNALTSQAVVTKDTVYNCATANVLLTAQAPTSGTGVWTSDVINTITNGNNHNALATNLSDGWNTFYYTVQNGVCPTSVDSMKVFRMIKPVIDLEDTTLCSKVTLALNGTPAPYRTDAIWYFEQGGGKFSDEFSASTQLLDYRLGTNVIIYSFNHEVCGMESDTLLVTFNNCDGNEFIIPTIITPNQDGKNDSFVISGLAVQYPKCTVKIVNRWGSVVFESEGYSQPWEGTFKGEPLPVGTYYYVIELNDESKNSLSGPISIIR